VSKLKAIIDSAKRAGVDKSQPPPQMPDEAARQGIRAYHGSPHSFDKFSTSQIGTGEGAQAYGRGLYFAEAENVAKGYRDQLSEGLGTVDGESIGGWAAEILDNSKGDPSALRARINMAPDDFWVMNFEEGIAAKDNLLGVVDRLESGVSTWRPGGHMYEVDIDATPDDFLDYDKPLSEQSDRVKEALGIKGQQKKLLALQAKSNELQALYDKALSNVPSNPSFDDLFGDSAALRSQGELLTEKNRIDEEIKLLTTPKDFQLGDRKIPIRVQDYFSGANLIQGQGAASEISKQLLDKGIKGIKYLDQGSRPAGKGTSNYVVFDDKLISIAKKYGVSIPIAAYIAEGIITPEEAQAVGFGSVVKKSLSDKTDEIQQGIGSLPAGDEMVTGGDLQFLMNKLVREQSVKQAKEQGYDLDNVMYHASKQDIEEFVPGYSDGLVFLTPNKEFANDWLGKGKFQERQGGTGSIEGVRAEKKRFMEEANNVLKSLPKDQRQQYFEEILNPQQQQLIKDERLADSAIYPVVTRTKKPFVPSKDVDVLEELYGKEYLDAPFGSGFPTYKDALKDGNYLLYENKEVVDFLKSKGYDSMFLKESSGADKPFTTLAVFDPNNIRSVNAKFDPEKKDSPQILASAPFATGITGLGAMAALPPEEAQAGVIMTLQELAKRALAGDKDAAAELEKYGGPGRILDQFGDPRSMDLSNLDAVPNVPQFALERYDPPRGRPSNLDQLLTPETAERLEGYARRGENLGGRAWYNTLPLRDAFIAELGPKEGAARFERYIDIVAATSPRSRVDTNVRRSSYLYGEDKAGRPIAGLTNPDFPPGYGHLAHLTQDALLKDLEGGRSFRSLDRPKTSSFAENLKGNQQPMTIDTHNFSAITGDNKNKKSPSGTQYKYLEEFEVEIADKLNMSPAQFQASVWIGADTGVADARPFLEVFDDVVARTAKKKGVSKQKALTDFIRGNGPLFGLAALMTAGAILPQRSIASDAGMGVTSAATPDEVAFKAPREPRRIPEKQPPGIASLAGQLGLGAMSEIGGAILGGAAGLGEYVRGGGLLGVPLGEPATAESIRDAREGVAEYVGGLYDAGPEAQELGQEIMQNFGETVSPFIDYAMEGPITDEYGINMVPLIAQKLGIPAYELLERLYYMMPEREQEAAKSGSEVYL
jgi:hypothetical protein